MSKRVRDGIMWIGLPVSILATTVIYGVTHHRFSNFYWGAPKVPRRVVQVSGDEFRLIFIGSTKCAYADYPPFAKTVERLKTNVRAVAVRGGLRFSTLGVAVDRNPDDGLRFIRRFGAFDEVAVGGGWLNSIAVAYMWREHAGTAGIPQVIVIRRRITYQESGIAVGQDSVIRRIVGASEIERFASQAEMVLRE